MKVFAGILIWIGASFSALGNNGNRVADRITPQVIQRGVETKVLLEGNRLENVIGILAYSEGVEFVRVEPADKLIEELTGKPPSQKPDQAVTLVLAVDQDCALGEHLFRVRTKETLSELLTVWISPYPCLREAFPGDRNHVVTLQETPEEKIQKVSKGTTVWGSFPGYTNFDQDIFRVDLKRGERLTAEMWGSCFSNPIDASMTLFGPDKQEITTVDDTVLRERDPFLSYIAEAEGAHYLSLHPFNDDENGEWSYALHLGGGKRPTLAYPMGGPAGTTLPVEMLGDVAGGYQNEIVLPEKAGLFEESIKDHRPEGSVIPVHLNVSPFGNVLEDSGSHGAEEKAQVYDGKLPVAFNGKIESEGEVDWFRFRARKGERYLVRTYAGTFGSPLDPVIAIKAAEGTESSLRLEGDDSSWADHDWCAHGKWRCKDLADPIVVFEADADGDYLLGVSDNQRLFSPEHIYRVEFQPALDRVWLQNTADYRESTDKRDAIVIHAGNSIERTYKLFAPPITRFNGEFDIVIKGLPKGVTYHAPRVSRKNRVIQMTFNAAPGTTPWAGFPEIELRPVGKGKKMDGGYRLVHSRIQGRGGLTSGFYRKTGRFALAVVAEAPLKLKVTEPSIGLAQNAFVDLNVTVERSQGFKGAVIVRALWVPDHVTSAPPLVIPARETSANYRLTASSRAEAGSFPLTLTAHEVDGTSISTGLGFHFVSSPLIDVSIVEPYLKITLERTAIERGKEGMIKGRIEHIRSVPSGTKATLINLPTGVTLLGDVAISPKMKEITFAVKTTSLALLGQAGGIACHITIPEKGQSVVQSTGVAVMRIDEERK